MAKLNIPTSSYLRKMEEDKRKEKLEKERRFDEAARKVLPTWGEKLLK